MFSASVYECLEAVNQAPWFIPEIEIGKVIKVVDGDTFHIIAPLPYYNKDEDNKNNSMMAKFSIRLRGIDTPEIKGPNHDKAIQIKNELSDLILGKNVQLKNIGKDKYGRLLCDVELIHSDPKDNINIKDWLLAHNYGYIYHGGKKEIEMKIED